MPKKTIVNSVLAHVVSVGSSIVSLLSGLLAASLILYSGYVLYDTFYTADKAFATGWDLLQYKPEIIDDGAVPLAGADMLAKINEDYRAWLTVYDTSIDYPVMQGLDDVYYARHDIYGNSGSITGAIYMSAFNAADFSDSYNLIYGHHVNTGAMFSDLFEFRDENYFRQHRTGILVTKDKVYDLTFFAVLQTDAYEEEVYAVTSRTAEGVISFLAGNVGSEEGNSTLLYDASVAAGAKKIAALSTCYDAITNGRLVVYANMVERIEEKHSPGREENSAAGETDPDNGDDGGQDGTDITEPDDGSHDGDSGDGGSSGSDGQGGLDGQDGQGSDGENGVEDISDSETPRSPYHGGISGSTDDGSEDFTDDGNGNNGGLSGDDNDQGIEDIDDDETPLAHFINGFTPGGSSYGTRAWALVNLLCVFVTAYLFMPVTHVNDKYGRSRRMKKYNEEMAAQGREVVYEVDKFKKRFRVGVGLEILAVVFAVIAFILTENMRLPMVLIDKWTPLMLVITLGCWGADVTFTRYRDEEDENGRNGGSSLPGGAQPA